MKLFDVLKDHAEACMNTEDGFFVCDRDLNIKCGGRPSYLTTAALRTGDWQPYINEKTMLDLLIKGHTFQKGEATIRLVLLFEYANDPLEFTCSISDIFKNVTPNEWKLKD